MNKNKEFSILKYLGVLLITIFGLWLVYTLVQGTGYGINAGFRGNHEGGRFYMGYGYGYGVTGTIATLLLILIKVLFVLFIVGLVIGIAIAIKNYIFTAEDVEKIKCTITGRKTVVIKEVCSICGKELESDWKVCPHCGKDLKIQNV